MCIIYGPRRSRSGGNLGINGNSDDPGERQRSSGLLMQSQLQPFRCLDDFDVVWSGGRRKEEEEEEGGGCVVK